MLQPISQLSQEEQINAFLSRPNWVAVCRETGAHLTMSYGRSRSGTGKKFVLILPKVKGNLFDYGDWDNTGRKVFKTFSIEEAINTANEKLAKMLAERQS